MTKLFFVRHAQPVYTWNDDRARPLTNNGLKDVSKVLDFFKTRYIDRVYSSPYVRCVETIESTAKYFGKEIIIDWMPYIIELDFEGETYMDKMEHLYIQKEFEGNLRADK